jgi:hypothetical protein
VVEVDDQPVRVVAMGTAAAEPSKKRNKFVRPNCPIEITLEGKNLWDEFCRRGTEMIVNRSGRYAFMLLLSCKAQLNFFSLYYYLGACFLDFLLL